ncbi:LD-carboxypeptidase [Emticicia sp. TH156]|uniref:S66 peptidase family protein n=1 Tax=Emticicia sp. TH156 TaxID=2067454 RepID=UPI000C75DBB1|nr:LD-carboxypeptidase [Emticicia sp. TH156]PLK46364.1 LD-carboxypeptidase [Emticicia sp. TH156]
MPDRRHFLSSSLLAGIGLANLNFSFPDTQHKTLKPAALKPGDTIGLVCPAYSAFLKEEVQITIESLETLGFKVKKGDHMFDRYGYLAGTDADRAADINKMFADKSINGIMAMHGGWGCARILPLLDYKTIQQNPKVFIGYSDITALLLGIYSQTGLVTFHGPVGSSTWNSFSVENFKSLLLDANAVQLTNPVKKGDNLVQVDDRIYTINPGIATGRLTGGNLTVLSHILGSPYVPDFKGSILFLEDVGEDIYRIDRMITQLKLAGILNQLSGFVFGKCTDCPPSKGGYGSLTMEDIFEDHIKPLNIPAFSGAMIGHIKDKFTVPVGIKATIDATKGSITLNESAVNK